MTNLDCGEFDPTSWNFVLDEIFNQKIYDYWVSVKENDVVVDVGSSVGPFAYTALSKKCKKIYCVEPSLNQLHTSLKNLSQFFIDNETNPIVFVNKAISDPISSNEVRLSGFDENFSTISFKEFVEKYQIERINFLKIDCEGGEYNIFTSENANYLYRNVDFISCELHGRVENGYQKFKVFKEVFLDKIPRENYKIMCFVDGIFSDVTDWVLTEQGFNHILALTEAMLYVNNSI